MSKPDPKFFEDLVADQSFTTGTRQFSAFDVAEFGTLTGDLNRIHFDEAVAQAAGFKARPVQGAFLYSAAVGLATQLEDFAASAPINRTINNLNFSEFVYVGEEIWATLQVVKLDRLRWLPRGMVIFSLKIFRVGDDLLVAEGELGLLIPKRPKPPKA